MCLQVRLRQTKFSHSQSCSLRLTDTRINRRLQLLLCSRDVLWLRAEVLCINSRVGSPPQRVNKVNRHSQAASSSGELKAAVTAASYSVTASVTRKKGWCLSVGGRLLPPPVSSVYSESVLFGLTGSPVSPLLGQSASVC